MQFGAQLVNYRCTWDDTRACIDLLGQYVDVDAGAEEIMFSSVPTRAEHFERIDTDVLSAFD